MKWPLVWRSTLDVATALAETRGVRLIHASASLERCEDALAHRDEIIKHVEAKYERDAVRSEARYADLMVSYRMLRLQGFTPAPVEPVAREAEKPDPVLAAINAVARDAKTRAMAIRQAKIDEEAGLTPVEIIQRIQRGNRPAEEIQ